MKREEYKRDLWQEYVENADYIERVWKEGVIDFGENFLNGNVTFCMRYIRHLSIRSVFGLMNSVELNMRKTRICILSDIRAKSGVLNISL